MPDDKFTRDLLRSALQRTGDCPPLEELERALDGANPRIITHAESCAWCSAELQMLRSFSLAEIPAEDARAVEQITQRLKERPVVPARAVEKPRVAWWRFEGSWLRPPALAFAAVLVVVAIGLQLHPGGPPALHGIDGSGWQVFRSGTLTILSPSGDLGKQPGEVRWEAVPSAATYQVRLLEVDGHELWSSQTTQTSAPFPANVQAQMVPAKTLLCQVTAFDVQGRKVAESETVRFRILQSLYGR